MSKELELPWGTDPLIGGEAEEQRARRQQAEEAIAAHLSLGMDQRAWFGFEEIAHELAKPSLGKLPEPELIAYQRKRLLDSFRNGALDREGAPTVLNRRSWMRPFSRELLLGVEREHQPAIDGGVYQADYVAQFYLSRIVTAEYLAANGHPWPVEWGANPLFRADAGKGGPETPTSVTNHVGVPLKIKGDVDEAYRKRLSDVHQLDGRYPTSASDEKWRKQFGISRPRLRELRKQLRTDEAKKGGAPRRTKPT